MPAGADGCRAGAEGARIGATLGEGPVWVAHEQRLWFRDIRARCLRRFDPASGALGAGGDLGPSGLGVTGRGWRVLVGMSDGLHRFDVGTGTFEQAASVEADLPGNRLNDATIDRNGRVFFGTTDVARRARPGVFIASWRTRSWIAAFRRSRSPTARRFRPMAARSTTPIRSVARSLG